MKLPLGSRERKDTKIGLEAEIVELADKWELERAKLRDLSYESLSEKGFLRFVNIADKLARTIRKWRRL